MEWVRGPSLDTLLASLRSGDGDEATSELLEHLRVAPGWEVRFFCGLGTQIARALHHAHERGLVHRDVKPSNVLLREDGHALLTDFGLVRSSDDATMTQSGAFLGTPAYAAPEQLAGDRDAVDARADVFSLAATLFECLTRERPLAPGESSAPLALFRSWETSGPRRLRDVRPDLPRDLETILVHALAFDPNERYPSAAAFADDLERLLALRPIVARPPSILDRATKFLRRHRTVVLLVSCAVLVAAAASWWLRSQVESPEARHARGRRGPEGSARGAPARTSRGQRGQLPRRAGVESASSSSATNRGEPTSPSSKLTCTSSMPPTRSCARTVVNERSPAAT